MSHVFFQCLDCKKDLPTSGPLKLSHSKGFGHGVLVVQVMCLIPRCFCTRTPSRRKSRLFREVLIEGLRTFFTRKGKVCTTRLFEILCNNDSLYLPNTVRFSCLEILETGHVFTFNLKYNFRSCYQKLRSLVQ